ncbi:MAG TPA: glycosyl hydrolase, partial [Rhodothermales bacterium]|nr:glycosyl hydrolase [Rhodothermales bacterium]
GGQAPPSRRAGQNAPAGVVLRYWLREAPDSNAVKVRLLDASGTPIVTYTPKDTQNRLPIRKGGNTLVWNLRYAPAETFPGMILWGGGTQGPRAVPGRYTARLIVGRDSVEAPVELRADPRAAATPEDYAAQFAFLTQVRDKLTETHKAIKRIRDARDQINGVVGRLPSGAQADSVKAQGRRLVRALTQVEEALYQTRNRAGQDPLNFPIKLNNRLSGVASSAGSGDFRPTDQHEAVRREVTALIDAELARLNTLLSTDVAAFNAAVRALNLDAVVIRP